MNKNAMIFSWLQQQIAPSEENVSKKKVVKTVRSVARQLGARPPRLIFGGEDYYDLENNVLSVSGSKPGFYHELGHYIQQQTPIGRTIENLGMIGDMAALAGIFSAPLLYPVLRTRMKPAKAFVFSTMLSTLGSLTSVLSETIATIRGKKYADEDDEILARNIIPSLTYAEPALFAGGIAGAQELLLRAFSKFKRRV